MIELPEAVVFSNQLSNTLRGRTICEATAGKSPHKFAWYTGDPATYSERLEGLGVKGARNHGGHVWIQLTDGQSLILGEGPAIRVAREGAKEPSKHQLFLRFDDQSSLSVTVQMYAFIMLREGTEELNPYLEKGIQGPDPLAADFTPEAFLALARQADKGRLTAKGLLATEQRIPGVGNGVLQDVLFGARISPMTLVSSLSDSDLVRLHESLQTTVASMIALGGRDTETDIFGVPGSYATKMSRKTVGQPCPECGEAIVKKTYMGGSVYFCPACQPG